MTLNKQYNFRTDEQTEGALKLLAAATHRSRAGVVRYLILTELTRIGASLPTAPNKQQEVKPEPVMS
jgi:hypothetical protein